MAGGPFDRERPAADHDQHDRRPGRDDRFQQLLLATHQAELETIAKLPGRGVVGQAGSLAQHDDCHVRCLGQLDGLRELGVGPVVDARAPAMLDIGSWKARVDLVEDRAAPGKLVSRHDLVGQREAEGIAVVAHLQERLDVEQVGVVAEQLASAIGDRPDHGHAGDVLPEGQDAVILDEHQRTDRQLSSDSGLLVCERRHELGRRRLDERVLEQAEPELHAQDAPDGGINERLVDEPVGNSAQEGLAIDDRARQLGIDAGPQPVGRSHGRVVRDLVLRRQHLEPDVVRGDDPVEAPFVAQDPGQQFVRGMTRHAVDVAVGRHDAGDSGIPYGGFEREQLLVAHLPGTQVHGRLVEAAFREPVADHVLAGRDHALGQPFALHAPDVGASELRCQVRILAVGLLDPPPARVAGRVEHGRQ